MSAARPQPPGGAPPWLPFLPVRRNEAARAGLAFLLFFLVIAGYYVLKPARDSFVLAEYGARALPIFYLTTAAVILGVAGLYRLLVDRFPRQVLAGIVYGFAVACLLVFWALLRREVPGAAAVFFVWLSIFNLFVVLMFWTLANDVFTPEEGKRLYGIVGAGGIAGGAVGGELVSRLAVPLGSANLLLVAAAIWGACAGVAYALHRVAVAGGGGRLAEEGGGAATGGGAGTKGHPAGEDAAALTWRARASFLRDPYAGWIALIVAGGTFLGTVYDLEFKRTAAEFLTVRDARTAYFGYVYARVSLVGLLIQFFVTPIVHRNFGPGAGLVFLPLTFLAGIAFLVTAPGLGPLAVLGILVGAFAYSINQSSKELLYTPTAREFRYKAKAVLDTFCFRLGDAIVSILTLTCTALAVPTRWLLVPCVAIAAAWLVGAWWLGREFRRKSAGG